MEENNDRLLYLWEMTLKHKSQSLNQLTYMKNRLFNDVFAYTVN